MKQRSPVSVANGLRGDCVASTMHSRLYFPQLRSGTHSELGQLRDTLRSQEKILASTRVRTRDPRIASQARMPLGHRAPIRQKW